MSRQVDDYVAVEDDRKLRPLTKYPQLLAKYLYQRFELGGEQNFLKLDVDVEKELLNSLS